MTKNKKKKQKKKKKSLKRVGELVDKKLLQSGDALEKMCDKIFVAIEYDRRLFLYGNKEVLSFFLPFPFLCDFYESSDNIEISFHLESQSLI